MNAKREETRLQVEHCLVEFTNQQHPMQGDLVVFVDVAYVLELLPFESFVEQMPHGQQIQCVSIISRNDCVNVRTGNELKSLQALSGYGTHACKAQQHIMTPQNGLS